MVVTGSHLISTQRSLPGLQAARALANKRIEVPAGPNFHFTDEDEKAQEGYVHPTIPEPVGLEPRQPGVRAHEPSCPRNSKKYIYFAKVHVALRALQ